MLRSIQLENFKAFGRRTIIPLAPITLIFGENSAGKSSILQSLNLLKQTRESRDAEALLQPRTENGFVDLGSFQEMLFDHDLSRPLMIRLDTFMPSSKSNRSPFLRGFPEAESLGVELQFVRRTLEEEVSLEKFLLLDKDERVASFTQTEVPEDFSRYGHPYLRMERRSPSSKMRAMCCESLTQSPHFWRRTTDLAVKYRERLCRALQEARTTLSREQARDLFDERSFGNKSHVFKKIDDALKLFTGELSPGDIINWLQHDIIGTVIAFDGFLPTSASFRPNDPSLDYIVSRLTRRTQVGIDWYPNIARLAICAGAYVERTLAALFPLGPFRKPAARLYIFTGTTPQDVGYQGHLLPDFLFRHPELVTTTNEWLKLLDIGYELEICPIGEKMSDLFEVRLRDMRRNGNVLVGLTDVGFGISQILPLVVQSLAGSEQIITIEQPEVHIHPRLQADLGDLLIEGIQEPRNNQFIIESHSEHLALRLQRRVREKKLSPKDISVVYVSRGPAGTKVQPLRLDDGGDFMDDFPGGFFPERLRELR